MPNKFIKSIRFAHPTGKSLRALPAVYERRWAIQLKHTVTLLLLFLAVPALSNEQRSVVVSIEHSKGESVVLLNGKKIAGLLLALSKLNDPSKPSVSAFLFVNPKTTIHEMSNMLGIMSKAGFVNTRVFIVSEDKSVMSEMTTGCSMLYSADASQFVLAHGGYGCTK